MARRLRRRMERSGRTQPAGGSVISRVSTDWIVGGLVAGVAALAILIFFLAQWVGGSGGGARPFFGQVFTLAASPGIPDTLFLGDAQGIFRSTNGGRDWQPHALAGEPVRAIFDDPSDPSRFWAAGDMGLYRSIDGGARWDLAPSDLPAGHVLALATDPADSQVLYAFVSQSGLYRTQDGGGKWALVRPATGGAITSLAVKPGGPDILYLFDTIQGFRTSEDGGQSLRPAAGGLPSTSVTSLLTFTSEPETVFAVAQQAVYKSVDAGSTWELASQGLEDVQAIAIGRDAVSGDLYVTNVQGEIYRSRDGGATWSRR